MRKGTWRSTFFLLSLLLASASLTSLTSTVNARPSLDRSRERSASFFKEVLDPSYISSPSSSLRPNTAGSICRPTGKIDDACCDFETVEDINQRFFDGLELIRTRDFFKYYKVDLFKDCPFWVENGLCMNRACGVETSDESEIPPEYRTSRLSLVSTASSSEVSPVGSDSSCSCSSRNFCHLDDENSSGAVYVDLLKNPERFTGYAGPSANRVWKSIYEENCFGGVKFIEPARPLSTGGSGFIGSESLSSSSSLGSSISSSSSSSNGFSSLVASLQAPLDSGDSEQCLEKRVFYRVISGLHASISIHICNEFLDQRTGEWAPNLECFITRIAEHPERLQNVYFNYVLILRALARLGDESQSFSLRKGDEIEDVQTRKELSSLIQSAKDCPPTFDEGQMFVGKGAMELKEEFRQHFRNVSSIMDCVGCDKCRLWGKLQINGLGTAMKLLFGGSQERRDGEDKVELQRSELVALVNTAHRFAESLRAVETFRQMFQESKRKEGAAKEKEPIASSSVQKQQQAKRMGEGKEQPEVVGPSSARPPSSLNRSKPKSSDPRSPSTKRSPRIKSPQSSLPIKSTGGGGEGKWNEPHARVTKTGELGDRESMIREAVLKLENAIDACVDSIGSCIGWIRRLTLSLLAGGKMFTGGGLGDEL
ncbi:endoplasmic oxidoreductin [Violaceomyces palustris]|uniref:Endoplasmic oxidoreductin n=1 Tax=Violaceomyces palustris TaxID=1673888 RepID=A0ACD0NPY2_9BASI|nr:endoplasmic oxidoreductin [Violaceomyces palustris]